MAVLRTIDVRERVTETHIVEGAVVELAVLGARVFIGLLLVWSSIPKLSARDEFEAAVRNYQLLPPKLVRPVARAVPSAELTLGMALAVGALTLPAAILAAAMLIVFATAVAVNLARGRRIDCGCAGISAPREITWGLVARDIVLAALVLWIAFASSAALFDPLPEGGGAGEASSGDAVAVILIATLTLVGQTVVASARRTLRAERRFREAADV